MFAGIRMPMLPSCRASCHCSAGRAVSNASVVCRGGAVVGWVEQSDIQFTKKVWSYADNPCEASGEPVSFSRRV